MASAMCEVLQAEPSNPLSSLAERIATYGASLGECPILAGEPAAASAPVEVPSLQLEGHIKALSQDNPLYPQRHSVFEELVPWSVVFPGYSPSAWTHPDVLANDRELSTGHKWADPPDVARAGLAQRISYAGDGLPKPLVLGADGKPRNPVGRTGLRDRGLLGKWGPNHAADPIVTRYHPDSGKLQMVAIRRKDTRQWAIPGGMVDDGEAVSATVRREFAEEVGNIADSEARVKFDAQVSVPPSLDSTAVLHSPLLTTLSIDSHLPTFDASPLKTRALITTSKYLPSEACTCDVYHSLITFPLFIPLGAVSLTRQVTMLFESGKEVSRGYVDDPRNTDNAWTETIAFHFHCSAELGAQLQLSTGDDAGDVTWLDIDMEEDRYSDLYGAHRLLVDWVVGHGVGSLEQRLTAAEAREARAVAHAAREQVKASEAELRAARAEAQVAKQGPGLAAYGNTWSAQKWLSSLGIVSAVSSALLGGMADDELQVMRALGKAVGDDQAELIKRLQKSGVANAIADVMFNELRMLVTASVVTAKELNSKWVEQEGGSFTISFGDLSELESGLEGRIGRPNPNVRRAMEDEHTKASDSKDEFTTANYTVTTTPEIEWWFVTDPEREGVAWPEEAYLPKDMKRTPMALAQLVSRLDDVNMRLEERCAPVLLLEEAFGVRLFTGAM